MQGRPKNPNLPPTDTTVRIKKEILDEIDRLINFQRMPLGQKIEHMVIEYKHLRKNSVGQLQVDRPNELNSHNMNTMNTIESSLKWSNEALELLTQNGWKVDSDGVINETENDIVIEND